MALRYKAEDDSDDPFGSSTNRYYARKEARRIGFSARINASAPMATQMPSASDSIREGFGWGRNAQENAAGIAQGFGFGATPQDTAEQIASTFRGSPAPAPLGNFAAQRERSNSMFVDRQRPWRSRANSESQFALTIREGIDAPKPESFLPEVNFEAQQETRSNLARLREKLNLPY